MMITNSAVHFLFVFLLLIIGFGLWDANYETYTCQNTFCNVNETVSDDVSVYLVRDGERSVLNTNDIVLYRDDMIIVGYDEARGQSLKLGLLGVLAGLLYFTYMIFEDKDKKTGNGE